MGETRVDLQHLLEDIRDAYPGALEESIVTEEELIARPGEYAVRSEVQELKARVELLHEDLHRLEQRLKA